MMLLNCWLLANGSVAKSLKDLQVEDIRQIRHSHEQKLSAEDLVQQDTSTILPEEAKRMSLHPWTCSQFPSCRTHWRCVRSGWLFRRTFMPAVSQGIWWEETYIAVAPYNLMLAKEGKGSTANACGVLQSVLECFSAFSTVNHFCTWPTISARIFKRRMLFCHWYWHWNWLIRFLWLFCHINNIGYTCNVTPTKMNSGSIEFYFSSPFIYNT